MGKPSTRSQGTIDKNAKTPKLILKRLDPKDLLVYAASTMSTESKFDGTITSHLSESDDWHLCVSTTSEEDFQAPPVHQNPNVCGKVSRARENSESTMKNEMTP